MLCGEAVTLWDLELPTPSCISSKFAHPGSQHQAIPTKTHEAPQIAWQDQNFAQAKTSHCSDTATAAPHTSLHDCNHSPALLEGWDFVIWCPLEDEHPS